MDLIFVSHNQHKFEEVRAILGPEHTVTSLSSLGWSEEIPETQSTLLGNAQQKARTVFAKLGRDCFADDTGLEIESLGNMPGVLTARFAGPNTTAEANRKKVLTLMKEQSNRRATFRTVIALILGGKEFAFEGSVSGQILTAERGPKSFGYDCLFVPSGYDLTYAEMPFQLRNSMSHRALALRPLRDRITPAEVSL